MRQPGRSVAFLAFGVFASAAAAACGSAASSGGSAPPADAGANDASREGAFDASQPASDATTSDGGSDAPQDGSAIGSGDATVVIPPLPSGCSQSLADKTTPPTTSAFIYPAKPVTPFYQWINNNGYCGEVSMIQVGMNNGQWSSQYNARLLCGGQTNSSDPPAGLPLAQSGPDASCDQNAQLLLDTSSSDSAPTCLSNFGLASSLFDYASEASGTAGDQSFIAWIKERTIAGDNVAIGVLDSNGNDDEYDHIVTIVKIGTNHGVADATYYADDVLYFDDHGLRTFENGADTNNPGVPPGTGADTSGCTPYVFGYAAGDLASTASAAHANGARAYSIVVPTGSASNYGFAVSGPLGASDAGSDLLPVTLTLLGTTAAGAANVDSPLVGYDYENPIIGTKDDGSSCTNSPTSSWMEISAVVTVSGLTAGTSYNLYEYDFATVSGLGSAAALAVPTTSFNANAGKATHTFAFVAEGPTATYEPPPFAADETVIFRAVPASAP